MRRTGNRPVSPSTATDGVGGAGITKAVMSNSSSILFRSRAVPVFPEEIELLLDRTVGVAEENRFLVGFVRDPGPAGHDEHVLRRPLVYLVADARTPASQIGRTHVCTPVTNAQLLCRHILTT